MQGEAAVFPMSLPRIHSYTWSDSDAEGAAQSRGERTAADDPLGLKDKELHLWVTYPERRKTRARRKRKGGKTRRSKRRLWAVVIIESLKQEDPFSYEVTLRRIYKKDERMITVWVRNAPAEQSDDAPASSARAGNAWTCSSSGSACGQPRGYTTQSPKRGPRVSGSGLDF